MTKIAGRCRESSMRAEIEDKGEKANNRKKIRTYHKETQVLRGLYGQRG
jgi:hypothetical protein